MSTKTITKRVALATVVALGAGVLSLVTVSSANAAAATLSFQTTNAVDGVTYDATHSVGYLGSGTGTGVAQTVTLLSSGYLSVNVAAPTDTTTASALKVTGGTILLPVATGGYATAAGTTAGTWVTSTAANLALTATVKPNAGVTSMTIQSYDGVTVGASSGGTLAGQILVTIASASVSGTPSPAASAILYAPVTTAGNDAALAADYATKVNTNYYVGNEPWNKTQNAQIQIYDAYGNAVKNTSGTHILTATATNGALVGLSNSSTVASPSLVGSAFSTGSSAAGTWALGVAAPSAAPLTTTVTVAYDGVVIGTKTFVFTGPVSKVTLSASTLIGVTGKNTVTNKAIKVALSDAAGNAIQAIAADTAYPASTSVFTASSANPSTSGLSFSSASTTTQVYADFTCAAVIAPHSDSVVLKYTNIDGSVVSSNPVTVSCSGAPKTYTASVDKLSYNPGDVATLTVKFLDTTGAVAADVDASGNAYTNYSGYSTTNPQVSVAGGTLAASVTIADATALGINSYRILTGSTTGNYQTVVNVTALTSGTAQTVAVNIATPAGTSLNDVLKGIVALIASINKQIAALAKLVTKK